VLFSAAIAATLFCRAASLFEKMSHHIHSRVIAAPSAPGRMMSREEFAVPSFVVRQPAEVRHF